MSMEQNEIQTKIQRALNVLFDRDHQLLTTDVKEETIAQHLATYLGDEFPDWHVDSEYNRLRDAVKRLFHGKRDKEGQPLEELVMPDIIIHRRQEDDNLLVIEIKKSTNPDDGARDRQKLKAFITDARYRYQYGLFLRLESGPGWKSQNTSFEWFVRDGR